MNGTAGLRDADAKSAALVAFRAAYTLWYVVHS